MPKKTARKAARPTNKAAKKAAKKTAPPPPAAALPPWALRMKAAREALGLSTRAAAARAGLRSATWSDLETGAADNPTAKTLQAVAAALGMPADRLLRPPRA